MKNGIDVIPKLMLVEDEAIIAMDMKNLLQSSGYEIMAVVASGEKALALLEEKTPDFILMDIRLSGRLDGLETARLIRRGTDIPIIFVTAYMDSETKEKVEAFPPSGFVGKPIDMEHLRAEMERLSGAGAPI